MMQLSKQAEIHRLLQKTSRNRPILVGVSGGCDSVFLLYLLLDLGFKKINIVHLNHALRGRESHEDMRFVKRLAEKNGCTFFGYKNAADAFAKKYKIGIEEAGRRMRWQFFAEVARTVKTRTLFLGHHGDDRVETLLHHLFRGAGLSGASSLRSSDTQMIGRLRLNVLRPLLFLQRREIECALRDRNIPFRKDASNDSDRHTRNRFRHQILPFLEKEYGRSIRATLMRTATIFEVEDAWMEEQAAIALAHCCHDQRLNVALLKAQPLALKRRIVRSWLAEQKTKEISFASIESILSLLETEQPAKINLPGNRHVRRRAGWIFIEGIKY